MKLRKLKEKYENLSAPVKAALWFTVCNIIQKGVAMITVPIFTRLLTTEQYGVVSVYQSWYQIITVFATLNLFYGVYNNGMVKYEDDKEGYTSSSQGLATVFTFGLFIVYLIGYKFWNKLFQLSTIFVVTMFVEILFTAAYSFWAARQRYEYKYKGLVIVTIIIAVGSPLLGILSVLLTEYKAEARVVSFALVHALVGLFLYIRNVKNGKRFFNRIYWKFMLKFNVPLVPHYLSQVVLQQSDRIMIGSMIGKDKSAIYSVVYNVSTLMVLVTTAINNSYIPYTYKSLKEKKYENLKKNTNMLIVLVGVCVFLVMAFGPEIIKIFAPKEYYEAIWIIPPVATTVYFMFLYPLFGNIEFYFEENKFVTIASSIGAVLNIILNFVFIPLFGYMAAGYTTLICYILFSASHYLFMKRVTKKHLSGMQIYNIKFICGFSLIVLMVMLVMLIVYKYNIVRYVFITILFVVILIKRDYFIKTLRNIKNKN